MNNLFLFLPQIFQSSREKKKKKTAIRWNSHRLNEEKFE